MEPNGDVCDVDITILSDAGGDEEEEADGGEDEGFNSASEQKR